MTASNRHCRSTFVTRFTNERYQDYRFRSVAHRFRLRQQSCRPCSRTRCCSRCRTSTRCRARRRACRRSRGGARRRTRSGSCCRTGPCTRTSTRCRTRRRTCACAHQKDQVIPTLRFYTEWRPLGVAILFYAYNFWAMTDYLEAPHPALRGNPGPLERGNPRR